MQNETHQNESVIVLETKEDVIRFISEEYYKYLQKSDLSERAIAKKIGVSSTFLNNLRNSAKKDISPDIAVKILRFIKKEEYIDQVLKILSPVCGHLIKYPESLPAKEEVQFMNQDQYAKLGRYFLSTIYARLISMIFGGMEASIDDLENISQHTKKRLDYLKDKNLIEIDGTMIRPSKMAKKIMSGKAVYIENIEDTIEQAQLFLSWMNPDLIRENKEFGFIKNFLALYYKEDLDELYAIQDEAYNKAMALSERKYGGDYVVGGGNFLSLIGKKKKKEKEPIDNSDMNPNKDLIQ